MSLLNKVRERAMLFHYGNCRKEIEELGTIIRRRDTLLDTCQQGMRELVTAVEDEKKSTVRLITEITEQKAVVEYTLLQKEELQKEFDAFIARCTCGTIEVERDMFRDECDRLKEKLADLREEYNLKLSGKPSPELYVATNIMEECEKHPSHKISQPCPDTVTEQYKFPRDRPLVHKAASEKPKSNNPPRFKRIDTKPKPKKTV
jgi:hypothetical protein